MQHCANCKTQKQKHKNATLKFELLQIEKKTKNKEKRQQLYYTKPYIQQKQQKNGWKNLPSSKIKGNTTQHVKIQTEKLEHTDTLHVALHDLFTLVWLVNA